MSQVRVQKVQEKVDGERGLFFAPKNTKSPRKARTLSFYLKNEDLRSKSIFTSSLFTITYYLKFRTLACTEFFGAFELNDTNEMCLKIGFSLKFANNIFIFYISCQFASNVLCCSSFYSVFINNKNLIIRLIQK